MPDTYCCGNAEERMLRQNGQNVEMLSNKYRGCIDHGKLNHKEKGDNGS